MFIMAKSFVKLIVIITGIAILSMLLFVPNLRVAFAEGANNIPAVNQNHLNKDVTNILLSIIIGFPTAAILWAINPASKSTRYYAAIFSLMFAIALGCLMIYIRMG